MKAVQWAPSGNMLDGKPGEVMALVAQDGRTFGYGGGKGQAMDFGTRHGDVSVLPGQWVVLNDDDTVTVQDDNPNLIAGRPAATSLPRPASCGARICTGDLLGPHTHSDGFIHVQRAEDTSNANVIRAFELEAADS